MSYGILRCPEQDSNLHASQHSHLKRARLPFRHLGFCVAKLGYKKEICKENPCIFLRFAPMVLSRRALLSLFYSHSIVAGGLDEMS